MNEAIKLGLTNGDVMLEIAMSWLDLGCYRQVLEALESTIRVKAATCANAEKARALKQCGLRLKGKTEADEDEIQ